MKEPGQPSREAERLAALSDYAILDTSPEQAFDDLTRLASHIMGVPIALVSLVDENRQWFKSRHGLDATETPRAVSFCGHAVFAEDRLVVPDAHADDRFADNPLVTGAPHVRFYAGMPLTTSDGLVLGTLCAIDHVPRAPTEEQLDMLEALGRQVISQMDLRLQIRRITSQKEESRAFFELSLDLHCVAGFDGYFKQLNPSWERLLGWTRDELKKKPFIEFVHEDDRESTISEAAKLADGNHETVSFDNRYVCRDGSFRTLSWKAAADLETGRLYAVARDVTTERAIEVMKSEFVSVVSHELRTPLTSIRGALRMVDSGVGGELPEKAASLIKIASTNTERLVRLVNDILDLEKIEAGKLQLDIGKHALRELAEGAVEALRGMADPMGVSLRTDLDAPDFVHADRDSLLIVLTNLISNAIKFSPEGTEVVLQIRKLGDALRFEVVDHGPGISEVDQRKLFRRFQQLDGSDTRRASGSGLGLAISKAIVEEHGGTVGVRSVLGKGSVFFFELPASREVQAIVPNASSTILLVEDDRDVAQVFAATLTDGACSVVHAESLESARRQLAERTFDAVLLDVGLPDGSGLDLVAEMKLDPRLSDIPVVVVSGTESLTEITVVEWLQKPLDDGALMATLRRVLRRPGAPRALIIEDDDDARQLLVDLLATAGVKGTGVRTGAEAIAIGREDPPDLIILDVGLPDTDGFEVVRALKGTATGATPMIVYTGRDLTREDRRALQLGRTKHMTKSRVSEDEFVQAVRTLVRELVRETHGR